MLPFSNWDDDKMSKWVKKKHMYLGLLNYTILVIFGMVGLSTSFLPPPNERDRAEPEVRFVAYEAPVDLSNKALANNAYEALKLPLTQTPPDWSIRRDRDHNLRFSLPTMAKGHDIVVLEKESLLRVTTTTLDIWDYFFRLHELTLNHGAPDWRTWLWAVYVELSIWSLILMATSGVYLWLVSRPKLRWAQLSFVMGVISFVALWALSR